MGPMEKRIEAARRAAYVRYMDERFAPQGTSIASIVIWVMLAVLVLGPVVWLVVR